MISLSWEDVNLVDPLVDRFDAVGDELVRGLSCFHRVMDMKPRDKLILGLHFTRSERALLV